MDELIHAIVAQLLKGQDVGRDFRVIFDIYSAWQSQADPVELRIYLAQSSKPERYPGARYLPSYEEIWYVEDKRIRELLMAQFAADVIGEGMQMADHLDHPEGQPPAIALTDTQGMDIKSIAKALSQSSPEEAVSTLIKAVLVWANQLDGETITRTAMASGHYHEDWKRHDAIAYVFYSLWSYLTGF